MKNLAIKTGEGLWTTIDPDQFNKIYAGQTKPTFRLFDSEVDAAQFALRTSDEEAKALGERQRREIGMFGMTKSSVDSLIATKVNPELLWGYRTKSDFAFSLLSDVQEMIERGQNEFARQTINIVKYIIDTTKKEAA